MGERKFAVVGGDLRQARMAARFAGNGFETSVFGIDGTYLPSGPRREDRLADALNGAGCVILPLPVLDQEGGISMPLGQGKLSPSALFSALPEGALCLAGRVGKDLQALAEHSGVTLLDYFDREELAVRNAVPTAEGAIQIAMEELPVTLHGSRCLVIGHGRIGRVLARFLRGLGAQVTVSARRCEDRAWIQTEGYIPADTGNLSPLLPEFDVVFNTVPATVLGAPELGQLRQDALCIDLASAPGGIDLAAASRLGLRCIWALSLPGKVAPYTSGEIVYETIMNMLQERRFFSR